MNNTRPYMYVVNEITGAIMPIETDIFMTRLRRSVWRHDLSSSVVGYLE